MAKFINVKELRSPRALARNTRGRPLGGNFDEPFAEDGEDDGLDQEAAAPAPTPEPDVLWMPHRLAVDSIRSVTPRLNGQPGGRIVLKNEKNILTVETFEEISALMDAP